MTRSSDDPWIAQKRAYANKPLWLCNPLLTSSCDSNGAKDIMRQSGRVFIGYQKLLADREKIEALLTDEKALLEYTTSNMPLHEHRSPQNYDYANESTQVMMYLTKPRKGDFVMLMMEELKIFIGIIQANRPEWEMNARLDGVSAMMVTFPVKWLYEGNISKAECLFLMSENGHVHCWAEVTSLVVKDDLFFRAKLIEGMEHPPWDSPDMEGTSEKEAGFLEEVGNKRPEENEVESNKHVALPTKPDAIESMIDSSTEKSGDTVTLQSLACAQQKRIPSLNSVNNTYRAVGDVDESYTKGTKKKAGRNEHLNLVSEETIALGTTKEEDYAVLIAEPSNHDEKAGSQSIAQREYISADNRPSNSLKGDLDTVRDVVKLNQNSKYHWKKRKISKRTQELITATIPLRIPRRDSGPQTRLVASSQTPRLRTRSIDQAHGEPKYIRKHRRGQTASRPASRAVSVSSTPLQKKRGRPSKDAVEGIRKQPKLESTRKTPSLRKRVPLVSAEQKEKHGRGETVTRNRIDASESRLSKRKRQTPRKVLEGFM